MCVPCACLSPCPPHTHPGILLACKDKSASSSSLKIEALSFLRAGLEANPPRVFKAHVQQLSTGVLTQAVGRLSGADFA